MLDKKVPVKVLALIFIAFGLVLCAAMFVKAKKEADAGKERVQVYFLDQLSNRLVTETYMLDNADNEEMADTVLNILYSGPKSKNLVSTFPETVRVLDGGLAVFPDSPGEYTLELQFSDEYYDMSPSEEQFFRGALVWSMTELDFIKDVHIFVGDSELVRTGGQPMGYLSRNNVLVNPIISPDKMDTQQVRLYFYDSSTNKLVSEERTIQVNPDHPIERYVMEQIISGPKTSGLSPVVPPETKIKSDVKTEEGICYVNLSNEFLSKNTAAGEQLQLNIYAVVNALTDLGNVKKVQFLIESEKIEDIKGSVDLSKPIERNDEVILR